MTDGAGILVTGATGYVGGRLVAALEKAGGALRCLARRPETLAGRVAASTEVVKGDCLRLSAEMRLPGRAWLQFEVSPLDGGRSEIRQTAIFDPAGLAGLLYWYALYPFHALMFNGMLRAIAARAEVEPPR